MRVLLTSSRAPVTLDFARRFHDCGDEVYVCDSLRFPCARFSNASRRSTLTVAPADDPIGYANAINSIVDKNKIDLLVPTCEEIFYIAALRKQIQCDVFVDDFENLQTIHNKWKFSQAAGTDSVKVPESFLFSSRMELDTFLAAYGCSDFVFKPVYSRFASETLVAPDRSTVDQISVSLDKPWIAQRRVLGQEFSTYSIARDGQLLAHCTYRSVFRAGVGSGICFQSVDQPLIVEFTKQFVERFRFTGQIGFDFMIDSSCQFWVLEGNPRTTSGLHLLPNDNSLVQAIKGNASDGLIEPRDSVWQQVFVAMLFFGLGDALKKRKIGSYLQQWLTSRDVVFRWSDPLPFLALPLTLGELYWLSLRRRVNLRQATTVDIEYNGECL